MLCLFSSRTVSPPRYGHSLLEESRNENHRLQEQVLALQNHVATMQDENDVLQQELKKFRKGCCPAKKKNSRLFFMTYIKLKQIKCHVQYTLLTKNTVK